MFNLVGFPTRFRKEDVWHLKFANRVIDNRLAKAINWYRNNYYYVGGYHILHRIIESFAMPKNIPDKFVSAYVYNNDKAWYHANALGLSSDRSIGKLHYGNFYGPTTTEIITQVDNYWDWEYVKENWQDLVPVTVLRHDQNHISYNLMTSKNYVDRPGFAIIQIDINLLHLQYAAWLRHHREIKLVNPDHKLPNTGYFLGMCVLPNMLPSHINQVIINKNILLTDDSMAKTIDYAGTSFYINNNSKELDKDIEDIWNMARKGNYPIEKIAANIHGVGDIRALEFMDTPKILLTRQNKWIYVLAMTRFLKHCLLTPGMQDKNVNNGYLTRLRQELISLNGGRVFKDSRISDLHDLYVEEIEWLFNL